MPGICNPTKQSICPKLQNDKFYQSEHLPRVFCKSDHWNMEETPSTSTNMKFPEDDAGESLQIDVHKIPEDECEQHMLPAEALFYALPYMSLHELIRMEQVCKASRNWVRDGVSLWSTLRVEWPLNERLTDEILIQLSKRSHGNLECLYLMGCSAITELAVEQIVMASPRLKKLFIPGCRRITPDGVVSMVRAHTNKWGLGMPGIKELKLKGIIGLTEHHVQSLLDILNVPIKPLLYEWNLGSLLSDYPTDVEACSECQSVRVVYNCSRDTCQEKQECPLMWQSFCTLRCAECGIRLKNGEQKVGLPKCSDCGNHFSIIYEVV